MTVYSTKEKPEFVSDLMDNFQLVQAEAAQYALMRRLAPAIRHNMVGTIQPLAMGAALLKSRLQKLEVERPALEKSASDITSLARHASSAAVQAMAWFAPAVGSTVNPVSGIEECLLLVQTLLSFQGFQLDRQGLDGFTEPVLVNQFALRSALLCTLLVIADGAEAAGMAGVLRLGLQRTSNTALQLNLVFEQTHTAKCDAAALPYRRLHIADAVAIASATGVVLQWGQAAQTTIDPTDVRLIFAVLPPTESIS